MFGNVAWGVWLWECGGLLLPTPAGPCWVTGQGLTLLGCSWVVLPWEWEEPRAPTLLKPPLAWGHAESPGSAAGRGSALCPPSTKANLLRGRSADATLSPWLEDLEREWRSNEGPWENIKGRGWEKRPQHKWELFEMLWQMMFSLIICQKYPGVRGHFALSCLRQYLGEKRVHCEYRVQVLTSSHEDATQMLLEAHPECNWNPPITHRD